MAYNRVKKTKPVEGTDKMHLTQKPVAIIEEFLMLSSKEGDLVLDAFMGSGTTAVACHKNKRHWIGFELNPDYFKRAERRIKAEQAQQTLF